MAEWWHVSVSARNGGNPRVAGGNHGLPTVRFMLGSLTFAFLVFLSLDILSGMPKSEGEGMMMYVLDTTGDLGNADRQTSARYGSGLMNLSKFRLPRACVRDGPLAPWRRC